MPHFFATADDLMPVFSSVESKRDIRYVLSGHLTAPAPTCYLHGAELPTLGTSLPLPSAIDGPAYLVMDSNKDVSLREIALEGNVKHWAIDQLENPDTTVLWHGGMHGELVLLHGRVATASKSPIAASLQRAFEAALKKHFRRVKAFYVGAQAESLLDRGIRLTFSAGATNDYDLCR
jgi:hypothetical protein